MKAECADAPDGSGGGGSSACHRALRPLPTPRSRTPRSLRLPPQKAAGEDAWAPVLLQHPHSSECLALGAALLRMGAAEAVHPLFLAGVSGTMQPLADAISMQVHGF